MLEIKARPPPIKGSNLWDRRIYLREQSLNREFCQEISCFKNLPTLLIVFLGSTHRSCCTCGPKSPGKSIRWQPKFSAAASCSCFAGMKDARLSVSWGLASMSQRATNVPITQMGGSHSGSKKCKAFFSGLDRYLYIYGIYTYIQVHTHKIKKNNT